MEIIDIQSICYGQKDEKSSKKGDGDLINDSI